MNIAALAAQQREDGLFRATITLPDGRTIEDANAFATALVLRRLRHAPRFPALAAIIDRALAGLERCAQPGTRGAYGFWPAGEQPDWARRVPADIDDTALILAERLRHHRIDRHDALRAICHAMLPWRVRARDLDPAPSWIAGGCFYTWASAEGPANIVDCCVNANAAALLAMAGATHLPGYDAAVTTIERGVDWAGGDPARLGALTPFYPAPALLLEAVEHAVEAGVAPLASVAARLCRLPQPVRDGRPGICRDAYGRTTWHSPAVEAALALPVAA